MFLTQDASRRGDLLGLAERPWTVRVLAVVLASLLLAISSYIVVPMVPVPITMQTFAVTFIGAAFGWRLGTSAVLLWLAEGAMGMPVFAGGSGSIASFFGPTAGYLFAFPLAAALTGWLAERGGDGRSFGLTLLSMGLGNLLCLAVGGAWLAALVGVKQAFLVGVLPFLVGGALKTALAAMLLRQAARPKQAPEA